MGAGRMFIVLSTVLQDLCIISFRKVCCFNERDYLLCCDYDGNVNICNFVVTVVIRHDFQDMYSL